MLTVRADSAFYSRAFVRACRDHDVRFSVTAKLSTVVRAASAAIPDDAWTPIPYWLEGGADVAETTYTAFKFSCRLGQDFRRHDFDDLSSCGIGISPCIIPNNNIWWSDRRHGAPTYDNPSPQFDWKYV